jgi:hypothetical protein
MAIFAPVASIYQQRNFTLKGFSGKSLIKAVIYIDKCKSPIRTVTGGEIPIEGI